MKIFFAEGLDRQISDLPVGRAVSLNSA